MAVDAHIRHIDAKLTQNGGDGRDRAGLILIAHDERIELSRKAHVDAVDLIHDDRAAADGGGLQGHLLAALARQFQKSSVRVRVAQVDDVKGALHSRVFRLLIGVWDAQVIRLHAKKPRQQRAVGTVAEARFGKRAVQTDPRLGHILAEQRAPHAADPCRARRVRAGRTDHHRPHHIKNIDHG